MSRRLRPRLSSRRARSYRGVPALCAVPSRTQPASSPITPPTRSPMAEGSCKLTSEPRRHTRHCLPPQCLPPPQCLFPSPPGVSPCRCLSATVFPPLPPPPTASPTVLLHHSVLPTACCSAAALGCAFTRYADASTLYCHALTLLSVPLRSIPGKPGAMRLSVHSSRPQGLVETPGPGVPHLSWCTLTP